MYFDEQPVTARARILSSAYTARFFVDTPF